MNLQLSASSHCNIRLCQQLPSSKYNNTCPHTVYLKDLEAHYHKSSFLHNVTQSVCDCSVLCSSSRSSSKFTASSLCVCGWSLNFSGSLRSGFVCACNPFSSMFTHISWMLQEWCYIELMINREALICLQAFCAQTFQITFWLGYRLGCGESNRACLHCKQLLLLIFFF